MRARGFLVRAAVAALALGAVVAGPSPAAQAAVPGGQAELRYFCYRDCSVTLTLTGKIPIGARQSFIGTAYIDGYSLSNQATTGSVDPTFHLHGTSAQGTLEGTCLGDVEAPPLPGSHGLATAAFTCTASLAGAAPARAAVVAVMPIRHVDSYGYTSSYTGRFV